MFLCVWGGWLRWGGASVLDGERRQRSSSPQVEGSGAMLAFFQVGCQLIQKN